MSSFRSRIRVAVVGACGFTLVAVAAGSAVAGSNPATLYACYDVYGNVRMSDTAQCKLSGGGRLVYWPTSQVPGPTGAQGPIGPQGPTGPTGPAGGIVGYQVVIGTSTVSATNGSVSETGYAYCPVGRIAVGGGGRADVYHNGVYAMPGVLIDTGPVPGGSGWYVSVGRVDDNVFTTGNAVQFTIRVACAGQ